MRIKDIPTKEDLIKYMEEKNVKNVTIVFEGLLSKSNKKVYSFDELGIDVRDLFKKYNVKIQDENYNNYVFVNDIYYAPVPKMIKNFMFVDIQYIVNQKIKCSKCEFYNNQSNNYCINCGYKL